jgi:hypothetical protein
MRQVTLKGAQVPDVPEVECSCLIAHRQTNEINLLIHPLPILQSAGKVETAKKQTNSRDRSTVHSL